MDAPPLPSPTPQCVFPALVVPSFATLLSFQRQQEASSMVKSKKERL